MEGLIYRLDQRPRGGALWLSTLQWFMFTLANIITVPIVVGHAFHLSAAGIAMFTERTFFVCGVIGFLQAWLGHRFPVIEGPAGMWWGVFLVLVQMAVDKGQSLGVLLQELELGLMVGGLVFIVLGVSGQLGRVRRLFTPAVTGTFLILVALQVAHSLVEGVLGIGFRGRETVAPEVAGLSVLVLAVAMGLMFKARGMVQSISVLIGLGCGWVLFSVFGLVDAPVADTPWVALPSLLPFGPPKWNLGVCLTGAITGGILLSNLIASLQALAAAAGSR
ncbi:hypothetical protein GCM10025857_09380 [Alicyclobacillus contaminans]|nr:hypothetical protein GCM10025857_09380 [Alicyclobacillus contaminans]